MHGNHQGAEQYRLTGGGAGIRDLQHAAPTVITFSARLTGAQRGRTNHYYNFWLEELLADL